MATSGARSVGRASAWGAVPLLAYIGAAIYFVSASNGTLGGIIIGLLQACVWPAYVVYHVLVLLNA